MQKSNADVMQLLLNSFFQTRSQQERVKYLLDLDCYGYLWSAYTSTCFVWYDESLLQQTKFTKLTKLFTNFLFRFLETKEKSLIEIKGVCLAREHYVL